MAQLASVDALSGFQRQATKQQFGQVFGFLVLLKYLVEVHTALLWGLAPLWRMTYLHS